MLGVCDYSILECDSIFFHSYTYCRHAGGTKKYYFDSLSIEDQYCQTLEWKNRQEVQQLLK